VRDIRGEDREHRLASELPALVVGGAARAVASLGEGPIGMGFGQGQEHRCGPVVPVCDLLVATGETTMPRPGVGYTGHRDEVLLGPCSNGSPL
jgi:hypothetical protein